MLFKTNKKPTPVLLTCSLRPEPNKTPCGIWVSSVSERFMWTLFPATGPPQEQFPVLFPSTLFCRHFFWMKGRATVTTWNEHISKTLSQKGLTCGQSLTPPSMPWLPDERNKVGPAPRLLSQDCASQPDSSPPVGSNGFGGGSTRFPHGDWGCAGTYFQGNWTPLGLDLHCIWYFGAKSLKLEGDSSWTFPTGPKHLDNG